MTTTIDNKIVEMAFQSSNFDKPVMESIGVIDKLKRALNFGDAGKTFSNITDAARHVNLGPIASGIETIASRFSAMGIIGITTLVNLTNAAVNAGKRIISALTIEPIRTGLTEYETKLNSIQTILANTEKEGTNLEIVTAALNQLNEYSDKTIYNFQQMTRNVGTFTAAGVSLGDSVAAIKGIANLAAISGSNAEQASTAMYQLSQALSTGTVRLMDWNSVVNAGMGGQVFQEAIKETARVHGVAIDQIIAEEGSFRDSLQRGWFTSEILTETLQKFTGDLNEDQLRTMGYTEEQILSIIKMGQTATDAATKVKTFTQLFDTLKEAAQSGWAQTWEIIIGDFEEAKLFFTEINNIIGGMIGESADARNAMLQGWKDLGGRNSLIESVRNAFYGLLTIITPIKDAFREFFPPMTAQQLFNITEGLRLLTEKFRLSSVGAGNLKRIFRGVFALLDIGVMAVSALAKGLLGLASSFAPGITSLSDFLARVGDFIVKIRDGLKSTDAFNVGISKIGDFISSVILKVKEFFSSFSEGFDGFKSIDLSGFGKFFEDLNIRFEPLKALFSIVGKILSVIGLLLGKLAPVAFKLGSIVADGVSTFLDRIMESIENFQPERVFDIINGGLLSAVLLAIRNFISKGSSAFDGIKDVLNGVRGSLEAWQASLKADVLLKIAAALGILTLSIIALSLIDSKKLTSALTAMTVMFTELGVSLMAFQKVSATASIPDMGKMALGLIAISSAMLLLSLAVAKLGTMEPTELLRGLLAITALVGIAKLASSALATGSGKMIIGAAAMIVFSFALRSLASAVEKLGSIDTGVLTQGLIGVGVLMTEIALFLKATDLSGMGLIKSVGILILAGAINLLVIAVSKLAEIDTNALTKGLVSLGVIFTELGLFSTLTGGGATLILTAIGVGIIAASMLLLTDVLERLGALSWEAIGKGLVAMAGALVLIGAAAYLIPPTLIITAAGLLVTAEALIILADAMTTMGGMSWEEIGKGLVVLAGSLLILTIGLSAMASTLPGAAALFVAAAALMALAPALKIMGSMSWEEMGKSLLMLAGVFLVLGVAGAVLTPVIPTLLGLGAAMLLIGVATLVAGVGILAFSAGLAALAVSGSAGVAALVLMITSIVGLIPMIVKTLGRALLALIDVLVEGAPKLLEGIVVLLDVLLEGLLKLIPKIVDVVMVLVESLFTAIAEKTPELVQAGYDILIAFLEGIADNIEDIMVIVHKIVTTFLNTVAEQIPSFIDSGWNLIISWIDGMKEGVDEHLPELIDSVIELGIAIVNGVVKGLGMGGQSAKDGIIQLATIIVDAFKSFFGINSPSTVFIGLAQDIVQGLINGFKEKISSVITTVTELGTKIVDALKGKYNSMVSAGQDLVLGFANGIKKYISQAVANAGLLAAEVLRKIKETLGIQSPSKEMISVGKFVDQGLANGISTFSNIVSKSIDNLGKDAISDFNNVISGISNAIDSDMNFEPTIRPVLDLSLIQSGSSKINGILGEKTISLSKAADLSVRSLNNEKALSTTEEKIAPVISFEQNNYSPEALSRIDIYRQTKNQLNVAKELIGAK